MRMEKNVNATLEGKKKNWGTIRALPPTTSTSFMDLDLCTRDGGQIADQ